MRRARSVFLSGRFVEGSISAKIVGVKSSINGNGYVILVRIFDFVGVFMKESE